MQQKQREESRTSFQDWLDRRLAENDRHGILPRSRADLDLMLAARGIEGVASGARWPDFDVAQNIRSIMGEDGEPMPAACYLRKSDNLPVRLQASDFLHLRILGDASASAVRSFGGSASIYLNDRVPVPRALIPRGYEEYDLFMVRVQGNCLEGLMIADGDWMIFRPTESAVDGEIVAVQEPGSDNQYVKRFCESCNGGAAWLETVPIGGAGTCVEIADAQIVGVKVGLVRIG